MNTGSTPQSMLALLDSEEIASTVESHISSLSLTGKDNLAQSLSIWKKRLDIVEKALLENLKASYTCKLDEESQLVSRKVIDEETGEVAMALKWKQDVLGKLNETLALSILKEANNVDYDNSIFYKRSLRTKEEIKALLFAEGLSPEQIERCFSNLEIKEPKIVIDSIKNITSNAKQAKLNNII